MYAKRGRIHCRMNAYVKLFAIRIESRLYLSPISQVLSLIFVAFQASEIINDYCSNFVLVFCIGTLLIIE